MGQGTQLVEESPQIKTTITGWINDQVVRQDVFVFDAEPVDTPSMSDVLDKAKVLGVDVAETWTAAFDQIAEVFPQTAEQPSGTNSIGPAVYLRPDAFESNLHPTQKKSITVKVGVYSDAAYTKLQTYLNLTFEDGETKREREATGIFRRDDPVWLKFQPPWGLTCRCGTIFLTIEAASRHGVSEAQEWQRTGNPPTFPSWVSMPPFDSELTPCEIIGVRGEIPYLMSHLESAPEWIVGLLGEIGPDAGIAIAELTDLLQRHGDVEVQLATVTALWRIENRVDRVLPAMLDLLKNHDPEVRCETLQTLGQMRPVAGKALPAILQAFSDTDSSVRSEAISLVTSLTLPTRDAAGDKEDICGFQAFDASLKNILAKTDVVPIRLLIHELADCRPETVSTFLECISIANARNLKMLDGIREPIVLVKLASVKEFVDEKYQDAPADDDDNEREVLESVKLVIQKFESLHKR